MTPPPNCTTRNFGLSDAGKLSCHLRDWWTCLTWTADQGNNACSDGVLFSRFSLSSGSICVTLYSFHTFSHSLLRLILIFFFEAAEQWTCFPSTDEVDLETCIRSMASSRFPEIRKLFITANAGWQWKAVRTLGQTESKEIQTKAGWDAHTALEGGCNQRCPRPIPLTTVTSVHPNYPQVWGLPQSNLSSICPISFHSQNYPNLNGKLYGPLIMNLKCCEFINWGI